MGCFSSRDEKKESNNAPKAECIIGLGTTWQYFRKNSCPAINSIDYKQSFILGTLTLTTNLYNYHYVVLWNGSAGKMAHALVKYCTAPWSNLNATAGLAEQSHKVRLWIKMRRCMRSSTVFIACRCLDFLLQESFSYENIFESHQYLPHEPLTNVKFWESVAISSDKNALTTGRQSHINGELIIS